jgi:SNF family Na+-dependent transporter
MATIESTRETWSSRTAFLLASVGAAVGFGNVWRFPALVYSYGGGVFFVPYIFALVVIGIPLLIQEIAMGQHFRVGDVGVSNAVHKHLRGVGLASVTCGFMVVAYYVPLIAWCFRAFFGEY